MAHGLEVAFHAIEELLLIDIAVELTKSLIASVITYSARLSGRSLWHTLAAYRDLSGSRTLRLSGSSISSFSNSSSSAAPSSLITRF